MGEPRGYRRLLLVHDTVGERLEPVGECLVHGLLERPAGLTAADVPRIVKRIVTGDPGVDVDIFAGQGLELEARAAEHPVDDAGPSEIRGQLADLRSYGDEGLGVHAENRTLPFVRDFRAEEVEGRDKRRERLRCHTADLALGMLDCGVPERNDLVRELGVLRAHGLRGLVAHPADLVHERADLRHERLEVRPRRTEPRCERRLQKGRRVVLRVHVANRHIDVLGEASRVHRTDADRIAAPVRRGHESERVGPIAERVLDGCTILCEEVLCNGEVANSPTVLGALKQTIPRTLRVFLDDACLLTVLLSSLCTRREIEPYVVLLAVVLMELSEAEFAGTAKC